MEKTLEKRIVKSDKIGEQYVEYDHPSGLKIFLYPMTGYSSSFALFGTRMGSIDTMFKTQHDTEYTVVPEGVAHFLEHKLFESEDGDAFQLFAQTGASANAYTSFDRTCYLFSTTDQFAQSLKHLLTFVQSPYFTQQTVQKEQGIIAQEINMYQDNPGWRVFFNLLTALYQQHPVRIDIAGTVDSIAKIDAELLYKCYYTFYNLNNMALAIAGNFDMQECLEIIDQNVTSVAPVIVEQKTPQEPIEIANKNITQKLSVSTPLFHLGFKERPKTGHDLLRTKICSEILLDLMAGEASKLYRRLYDDGLINHNFGAEVFTGRGFFANIFAGESKDPERVQKLICQEVEHMKQCGIDADDFERAKKARYGKMVRGFNSVENVANGLLSSFFSDFNIFDHLEVAQQVTCEEAMSVLHSSFDIDKAALSVVRPLES